MKRLILVFIVLLAVQAQPDPEFVDEEDTACWECHAPGERSVPMDPAIVAATRLSNESAEVLVINPWLSELIFIQASMDLRDSPHMRFQPSRSPEFGRNVGGSIDAELATEVQTDEQFVPMLPNATFVRVTLNPANQDETLGPDLTLMVQPTPGLQKTANQNGRGASETVTFDLDDLKSIGSTSWKISASMYTVGPEPSFTPPGEYLYTATIDTFFNSTERVRYQASDVTLEPGAVRLFTWPIERIANGTDIIHSNVNATMYYEHGGGQPDVGYVRTQATTIEEAIVDLPDDFDENEPVFTVEDNWGILEVSEIVGYAAGMSMIFSIVSGGIFGKASRRGLNKLFGQAKRRVAFHNFLSYGLTLFAITHLVLFVIEIDYHWSVGILWGGLGILCMLGLGVTGAMQVPMIRRFSYTTWRNWHFWLAIFALLFTAVHLLLDGRNFQQFVEDIPWEDPVVRFFDP